MLIPTKSLLRCMPRLSRGTNGAGFAPHIVPLPVAAQFWGAVENNK
jgi:hypothetical protein